jgi:hypothetical protein
MSVPLGSGAQAPAAAPAKAPAATPPASVSPAKQQAKAPAAPPKTPNQVNPPPDQNPANAPTGIQSSSSNVVTSSPLKITLTPSELPLKLGSDSNIAADIQNVSNQPVELENRSLQLMTHAILTPSASLCSAPLAATTNSQIMQDQFLVLEPQDHITVFFNLSQRSMTEEQLKTLMTDSQSANSGVATAPTGDGQSPQPVPQTDYQKHLRQYYDQTCQTNLAGRIKRAIDFTPGNYDYYLSGRFSVCSKTGDNFNCFYPTRSFGQNATFQVGIDQALIIIFAIVGGVLAYLVVAVQGTDGPVTEFFALLTSDTIATGFAKTVSKDGMILILKILRDTIGVAILASAFTIVTSRLSDSQFPIKISVLDVWGAITIGFLSYFVGNKFIDSLRGMIK